jgi:hypothetical protein
VWGVSRGMCDVVVGRVVYLLSYYSIGIIE